MMKLFVCAFPVESVVEMPNVKPNVYEALAVTPPKCRDCGATLRLGGGGGHD